MSFPGLFRDHFVADKLHNINVSFVVDSSYQYFGGTAANIAYNLGLLGEGPTIISTAGGDFEPERKWLEAQGVDCSQIHIDAKGATASVYTVTDKANNQISAFYPGASERPYGDVNVNGTELAIVAPGAIEDMVKLPVRYRERGIKFFFDPGQRISALSPEQLQNGIDGAEIVFANDYELQLIIQKTGWREDAILARAGALVVTMGGEGSRVRTLKDEFHVPAVKLEKVVDPTGAGDAHRAGFIKGTLAGMPIQTAAKLASVTGSYAVEHLGTQQHRFTLADIRQRFTETYGEALDI